MAGSGWIPVESEPVSTRNVACKTPRTGPLRKSPNGSRIYRVTGLRCCVHQVSHPNHVERTTKLTTASSVAYPALAAIASAGAIGPGGPTPRPSFRIIFSTLWANAAM